MLFQKASPRGYPPSPRGARPEDLQELEDLLRQPGAREAAAEAAAHAVAPAAPPAELPAETETEEGHGAWREGKGGG